MQRVECQPNQVVKIYSTPGANVEVQALRGISTRIRRGEYVAIVGASGSGKSTLMNIIGCLDRLTAGTYRLYGEDVSQLDDDALSDVRGQRIGFIFQNFNLIPSQTVLENLETPMFYQGSLIGIICAVDHTVAAFDERDVNFLSTVGN